MVQIGGPHQVSFIRVSATMGRKGKAPKNNPLGLNLGGIRWGTNVPKRLAKTTAGFFTELSLRTPPPKNFWEKFLVSPRTKKFSAVDTQTAVLVSTAEVWISAPDTQTPIFLGFLSIHSWLWFFRRGTKVFGYFPEVPVTKIRVAAAALCKKPTVKRERESGGGGPGSLIRTEGEFGRGGGFFSHVWVLSLGWV